MLLIACMMTAGEVFSQQFQQQFDLSLPDSILTVHPYWVDLDNDGLLDVLLVSNSKGNTSYFQFVKGDTVNAPVLHEQKISTISVNAFLVADYNRDNKMDVIVAGKKNNLPVTAVYINNGSFSFEERIINAPAFSIARFADLDNDGRPEWIVSDEINGQPYVKILRQTGDFSWEVANDSIRLHAAALEIVDANRDGFDDIFISGRAAGDSLATGFLINSGPLYFKPDSMSSVAGVASSADINQDGFFDILLMGYDTNGNVVSKLFESEGGNYTIKDEPVVLREAHPFLADLNSDGITDVSYLGKLSSNDTLNMIRYGPQDYDSLSLNTRGLVSQQFGDAEHDGDLDLLQLLQSDVLHLVLYRNTISKKNSAPGVPKNGIAVTIFDRLFMHWDKPADDHTAQASITYDIYLEGGPGLQVGAFDLLNDRRLSVSHGNNGTENFRLLSRMPAGLIGFSIQAVDNAFHAGALCMGGPVQCVNVANETLSLCSSEEVNLTSPANALWFSFSKGFLGTGDAFTLRGNDNDTVFYFNPAKAGCAGLKIWTVEVNDDTVKTELSEKYACTDSDIQFQAEQGWETITWQSQLRGDLGTSNMIPYHVTQPDSIVATLTGKGGCKIVRKTAIEISKPSLTVDGDQYKILKGSSVQLNAHGAQRYQWTPSTGLSKIDIANPVASPASSIQYTVTGYDSLDCEDRASVNVIVEGAGFIPNLFTPNDDGKNDQLKIYGLPAAKDFTFAVYNREGSLVFKTSDVSQAVQQGWDGTKNGTKQPAGVYFWKVGGELASGELILLNGKNSGSVVLVR